jgi:hypothetical protein
MLKSTRRKLFYALVALFLVLGTSVVLYAEGVRFDFSHWRFTKAGGIFVRAYPEDAAITLDNKPIQSQIGILSRGTLINGLIPRTYTLALTEPDYDAWQESAAVEPSMVTEFKYAVLVPDKATTVATGTLTDFALTGAGLALRTPSGILTDGKSLGRGTLAATDGPRTSGFLFVRPSGTYDWYDPTASSTTNLSSVFAANGVALANATVVQNPYNNPPQIAAITQSRLWIMDLATQGLAHSERVPSGAVFAPTVAFSPSWIAWTTYTPTLNVSSLNLYNFDADVSASSSATIPGETQKIQWLSGSTFAVLQNTGELYQYDLGSQAFIKMTGDATAFAASDDGAMLAALGQHSLEVFALAPTDNSNIYWRFNLPDIAGVQKLIWYRDDRHLFVVYPDRVAFLDLADSSLTNFTTIAYGTSPEYDPSANALYLLDTQKNLVRFDFPG